MSKLKVFANHIFSVAQITEFVFSKVENIVGKGENVGSIFSFSHYVFERELSWFCLKSEMCCEELGHLSQI